MLHWPEMAAEALGGEAMAEGMRAFAAYGAVLEQPGVLLSAEVLQPSANTALVRAAGGELRVQDGPFADTKEQLGGTVVIDVPDLDAALQWAPGSVGAVGRGRSPARREALRNGAGNRTRDAPGRARGR